MCVWEGWVGGWVKRVCYGAHVLAGSSLPLSPLCSDSDHSIRSEDLPEESTAPTATAPRTPMLPAAPEVGLPRGLEGYSEGQTLRRCIQQGWLYKRSEGTLFNKYVFLRGVCARALPR